MIPDLFQIGSFRVGTYGVLLVIAIGFGLWWAQKRAFQFGADPNQLLNMVGWLVFPGILGARILFVAQEWDYYSRNADQLWSLRFDGLTSFGGFLGGFIGFWIWSIVKKQPMLPYAEAMAAPLLVANGIGRIGCFLNGCCFGVATQSPFGVHFHGTPGTNLPSQLLETVLCFFFAWVLVRIEKTGGLRLGQSVGLAFALLGLSRFIYEFTRAGSVDEVRRQLASSTRIPGLPITEAHLVALALIVAGLTYALVRRRAPLATEPAAKS